LRIGELIGTVFSRISTIFKVCLLVVARAGRPAHLQRLLFNRAHTSHAK
jgi:hypothetical protein